VQQGPQCEVFKPALPAQCISENGCWTSPAQSFFVPGPVGTHDLIYIRSKTVYMFGFGVASSTRVGVGLSDKTPHWLHHNFATKSDLPRKRRFCFQDNIASVIFEKSTVMHIFAPIVLELVEGKGTIHASLRAAVRKYINIITCP
jgi:hypothetical protein